MRPDDMKTDEKLITKKITFSPRTAINKFYDTNVGRCHEVFN